MDDLAAMGYTQPSREKVLVSTIKGYCRLLKKCSEGAARRNRKGVEMYVEGDLQNCVGIQSGTGCKMNQIHGIWFPHGKEEDWPPIEGN